MPRILAVPGDHPHVSPVEPCGGKEGVVSPIRPVQPIQPDLDFGQFAGGFFAEGYDVGEGGSIFALEAVEQGETIFDVFKALG